MIKIERTKVSNMDNAIRGMRNAMQSWEHADSWQSDFTDDGNEGFVVGSNDMNLAQRLIRAGSDERKFLRQIFVSVDVTAPLYWWKEYDTYKVATVANSTSTMHKIHAKEFTPDDFSHEHLSAEYLESLNLTIAVLNKARRRYNETKDKQFWHDMIQLLPSSYNQMRTCTLNYENLLGIYFARRYHKLTEWHDYCDWIMTLPYASEFFTAADKATKT